MINFDSERTVSKGQRQSTYKTYSVVFIEDCQFKVEISDIKTGGIILYRRTTKVLHALAVEQLISPVFENAKVRGPFKNVSACSTLIKHWDLAF